MRRLPHACLFFAACEFARTEPPPTPPCSLLTRHPSADGRAGFAYIASRPDLATPMVAGGALTYISACVRPDLPNIANVSASSPAVALVGQPTLPANSVIFWIESGVAGDTDLLLRDVTGNELARTTLHVADATELAVDRGWGTDPAPTLLDGGVSVLHVTTLRGAETLIGVGAVHYAFTGAVEGASFDDALSESFGDAVYFRARAGGGTVSASCPSTSVQLPISVVEPSALTQVRASASSVHIAAGQEGTVHVSAFAGTTPVYDVRCTWSSQPAGVDAHPDRVSNEGIGGEAGYWYRIKGPRGSYTATCTVPGGLSTAISVAID